jgi:uncharacterized membrane protein YhdT
MGAVGDLLFCKCASIVVWWVLRTIARHFPSPTFPSCPVHLKASCWIRALLFVSITTYCVSFLVDACHLHKDRHWISCYPRVITSSGSFCLVVSGRYTDWRILPKLLKQATSMEFIWKDTFQQARPYIG